MFPLDSILYKKYSPVASVFLFLQYSCRVIVFPLIMY